jgi:phage portal protein BeeE
VGVLDRVNARAARRGHGDEARFGIDDWISQYLIPSAGQFNFGGVTYPFGGLSGLSQTLAGARAAEIANSLPGYRAALQQCPPAFAAQMVRALVLSQARFTFRNPPWHPRTPRRLFSNGDLAVLEKPWPNGTTGDLVSRMEWHAGLAGNAFVLRQPRRLRVMRPDWTAILYGSETEPEWPSGALDAELLGYVHANRGIGNGEPRLLLPADVAHWAPLPDPEMTGLGMSWLTPAIREMQVDRLATEHQLRFFENGATPNLVVKGIPAIDRTKFDELVAMMEAEHAGVANAYRTLYLVAGADAQVIGSHLADLDLKGIQGARETRLSVLSRVPAALLGISEGLSGSSLNAGNFSAARRLFTDSWVSPSLQGLAAALSTIMTVPDDAELWTDTTDMPILREDAKDAADIGQVQATTIATYVKEGFTPESSIAAVRGQDVTLLKHSGMVSVQLWAPGGESPRKPEPGAESPSQPTGSGSPSLKGAKAPGDKALMAPNGGGNG